MPQIRVHAMPGFLEWAEEHGVDVRRTRKQVQRLRATQLEIDPGMVERVLRNGVDAILREKPMLSSSDDYILDGHHRWAALLVRDPEALVELIEFMTPIKNLLELAWSFPDVEYSDRV
jgi:hypothetical protein